MSNTLNIEVLEFRMAKSSEDLSYALYVYDSYDDTLVASHTSYEALLEYFPTRVEVLKYIKGLYNFSDCFELEGSEVTFNTISSIHFSGFPSIYDSDDSFTVKED